MKVHLQLITFSLASMMSSFAFATVIQCERTDSGSSPKCGGCPYTVKRSIIVSDIPGAAGTNMQLWTGNSEDVLAGVVENSTTQWLVKFKDPENGFPATLVIDLTTMKADRKTVAPTPHELDGTYECSVWSRPSLD